MKRALNLTVVVLLIISSTALLTATIGKSGVRLTGDTKGYLGSAMSLAIGEGFVTQGYSPGDDTIAFTHLSHYPPLLSSFYSLFIILGVDPAVTLTVVSVFGWVMLLITTAIYAFTNTKSYSALILTILLTSITYPYLWHYGSNISEVLFLPFLVLTIILATVYRQTNGQRLWYLVLLSIVLALTMLTRYVGVLLYTAILLWWLWWRIHERNVWNKCWEAFIITISAIPLSIWVFYNWFLSISQKPFSDHFTRSSFSFLDGVVGALYQIPFFLLPAIRFGELKYFFGEAHLSIYVVAAGLFFLILWRYFADHKPRFVPPESPALLFCFIYVSFYIFVQPIMSFWPLDSRDVMPVLVLVLPLVIFMAFRVKSRQGPLFAKGYVGLNVLMLALCIFAGGGITNFVEVSYGTVVVEDLAGDYQKLTSLRRSALPRWILRHPPRASHLVVYHQDLYDWLRVYKNPYVVLGDHFYKDMFIPYGIGPLGDIRQWLGEGTCASKQDLILVIFHWGDQLEQARSQEETIKTRCSKVQRIEFSFSVVYVLRGEIRPMKTLLQEISS